MDSKATDEDDGDGEHAVMRATYGHILFGVATLIIGDECKSCAAISAGSFVGQLAYELAGDDQNTRKTFLEAVMKIALETLKKADMFNAAQQPKH